MACELCVAIFHVSLLRNHSSDLCKNHNHKISVVNGLVKLDIYEQQSVHAIDIRTHRFCAHMASSSSEVEQWEAINCKQITRWQHVSQLKASSFSSWQKKSLLLKMQQLILGTGTAIWWLTEPHCLVIIIKRVQI